MFDPNNSMNRKQMLGFDPQADVRHYMHILFSRPGETRTEFEERRKATVVPADTMKRANAMLKERSR